MVQFVKVSFSVLQLRIVEYEITSSALELLVGSYEQVNNDFCTNKLIMIF
jgi:hypothetical protein